jgi:hypothetical protein
MRSKTPELVGAFVAIGVYLIYGLYPAFLFGGYAGKLLAGGFFGNPVPQNLIVGGLVGFGGLLGVVGVGSLAAVVGAATGAIIGLLVELARGKAGTRE